MSGWLVAGAIVGFLILGFVTRRALLALVPVLAFIVFGAAMLNDNLYARVSEDAQVGIYFVLAFGAIMTLAGAAGRRAADAGRRSRK